LFGAIARLEEVRELARTNDSIAELHQTVNSRLKSEGRNVSLYLTNCKWDLIRYCPQTCKRIEALLYEVSFDKLVAEERGVLGLVVGLWDVSKSEDPQEFKRWVSQMKVFEKGPSGTVQTVQSAQGLQMPPP
jgi:hypothetical protein